MNLLEREEYTQNNMKLHKIKTYQELQDVLALDQLQDFLFRVKYGEQKCVVYGKRKLKLFIQNNKLSEKWIEEFLKEENSSGIWLIINEQTAII